MFDRPFARIKRPPSVDALKREKFLRIVTPQGLKHFNVRTKQYYAGLNEIRSVYANPNEHVSPV